MFHSSFDAPCDADTLSSVIMIEGALRVPIMFASGTAPLGGSVSGQLIPSGDPTQIHLYDPSSSNRRNSNCLSQRTHPGCLRDPATQQFFAFITGTRPPIDHHAA